MEAEQKARRFKIRFRTFVVSSILGVAALFTYFAWSTRSTEEATCLAYVVDQKLDQFAFSQWRGERSELVEKQIEAIVRIEIARAATQKSRHCSESWVRWNVVARTRYIFGAKEGSARWRSVFNGSLYGLRGQYKHPWPKEWECVNEYASSRSPRNWGKRWTNRSKKAGDIGNLSLYCV